MAPILKALQLTLRGEHGFHELAFGRVLELEVEAFHGCVVRRELLSQLQVKNGVSREPLQIIEDHDAIFAAALLQKLEHGDHAGAIHEVAAAGDIIVEHRFDAISTGRSIFAASMFLTMQSVAVVLLLFVGNTAVDDGFLVGHRLLQFARGDIFNVTQHRSTTDRVAQCYLRKMHLGNVPRFLL